MRRATRVVVSEAGEDVRGAPDVEVCLRIGALQNVDESPVFWHAGLAATLMPDADPSKQANSASWNCEDRRSRNAATRM